MKTLGRLFFGMIIGYLLFELFKLLLAYPMGSFARSQNMSLESAITLNKFVSGILAFVVVLVGLWLTSRGEKPARPNSATRDDGAARRSREALDKTIQVCTELLKGDPRNADALSDRASARRKRGDLLAASGRLDEAVVEWDGAIQDFTQALDGAPADWPRRSSAEADLQAVRERRGMAG